METLSSRKRVINAIEHKPVDRYPIDLGANIATGISTFAYHNLRKYLGMSTDNIEIFEPVQMLARVDNDIAEYFHVDTRQLKPRWRYPVRWNARDDYSFVTSEFILPNRNEAGEYVIESKGLVMRMPDKGFFFDGDWIYETEMPEAEYMKLMVSEAEKIRKEGDYFCIYNEFPAYYLGMDFACDMYTDPESVIERNNAIHKSNIGTLEVLFNLDKQGYIDCVSMFSDLGAQNAPIVSPEKYEEFCYPYLKKFCEKVHQNTDKKVFLHSCGSIEPLLPYIIDAGIDIINPVQISAANMSPEVLKQKYGEKICFWGGGCDTQFVLDNGTKEQIADNVKQLTSIFKQGSGFVFSQVHNIQGNVPPENIVTMLKAAYDCSWYD